MKIAFTSIVSVIADRAFFRDIRLGLKQQNVERDLERIKKLAGYKRKLTKKETTELYLLMQKDIWFSGIQLEIEDLNEIEDSVLRGISKVADGCLTSIRIYGYRKAKKNYKNEVLKKVEDEGELSLSDKILFPIMFVGFIVIVLASLHILSQIIFPFIGKLLRF